MGWGLEPRFPARPFHPDVEITKVAGRVSSFSSSPAGSWHGEPALGEHAAAQRASPAPCGAQKAGGRGRERRLPRAPSEGPHTAAPQPPRARSFELPAFVPGPGASTLTSCPCLGKAGGVTCISPATRPLESRCAHQGRKAHVARSR